MLAYHNAVSEHTLSTAESFSCLLLSLLGLVWLKKYAIQSVIWVILAISVTLFTMMIINLSWYWERLIQKEKKLTLFRWLLTLDNYTKVQKVNYENQKKLRFGLWKGPRLPQRSDVKEKVTVFKNLGMLCLTKLALWVWLTGRRLFVNMQFCINY